MFLENYIDQINKLCENHKVRRFFAFGSVIDERFTEGSDIDLIVDFRIFDPLEYAENYFALKFSLEELLKRPVDLLEQKAIQNKYLLQNINKSKRLIYES
ncbi:MAG: nucleotidyltransferase family protein [Bacteroidales bacterium]